ncbi:Protein of unknown function [Colwellia chukchiensis]|uniref:DUF2982 domain-containing protein n=1 Tax=Colwellia chukchiensis TaxID=641665 RepID=A0A1H7P913_9GAMM|nr:DUF2982 domain-containing protein [Colwellia chukchiensis]SEL31715.1 Protein of unknown function [Colwellia chukchiensis]
MANNNDIIKIKAIARHHGLFITLTGSLALLVIIWLSSFYWQQARLPLLFSVLAALVTIFIGLLKLAEPTYSLQLSPETLTFYHRYGRWQLPWQQIGNIHAVTNTFGITREELNYVGIKLNSIETIATSISLRLANRLIHEQKPLLHYCIKHQLIPLNQGVLNFSPYSMRDGSVLKGPMAAFLHHSAALEQALGAQLFISANSLNGSIDDFVHLANGYLTKARSAAIKSPR